MSPFFGLFLTVAMGNSPTAAAAVHALFDLRTPVTGPFPSDRFTVADSSHNTRRQVNLPTPDCGVRRSDCEDLEVINTLDGFNLQPRLSIPFDGAIDVSTVTSNTVFLISLSSTLHDDDDDSAGECGGNDTGDDCGHIVGINQVVWDVATTTLHVKSDEFLDQYTRYALIVTEGVHDSGGAPVEASNAFRHFRQEVRGDYRHALLHAIHAARRIGIRERDIVTASVFTTESATAILEKIRDQIEGATPDPADFLLGPNQTRTVFSLLEITGMTSIQHIGVNPDRFSNPVEVPVHFLRPPYGSSVDTVAFGKYSSPDYEVHPGEFIPAIGTRTGTPSVRGTNEIYFNLFLPSGPKPRTGWPVTIFGHGGGNSKNEAVFRAADSLAARGIASIAINAVGHGFGHLGTLTVDRTVGGSVTFLAGGRGIAQSPAGTIGPQEGMSATPPREILRVRDGFRQTAVDLMQLVRVIQVGMDVDGDGLQDLDPSRIYYLGFSQAGMYGTLFLAVEPNVRVGVLTSAGPALPFIALSQFRGAVHGAALLARVPPLINAPGIDRLDDAVNVGQPWFNENMPLRDGNPLTVRFQDGTTDVIQSPVINAVDGAMAIQEALENAEWAFQSANLVAYVAHLRKNPLTGVPAKSVIYNYAKGDQAAPNPQMTALLRAGDLADRATFYRNDLAFAEDPSVPRSPHNYVYAIDSSDALVRAIARGAQDQIAVFFASDGEDTIHPEPARFFEVPIVLPLPEGLNYIP